MSKGARKIYARLIAGCLVVASIGIYVWRTSVRPPLFELYVFDTPGAPSLFIRTEDDRRILVHGGANADIVTRLTDLLPFYSRRIDQIVALDDDPKHVTGLIEVLNRYAVGSVVLGTTTSSDPTYAVFMNSITGKGIARHVVSPGDHIGNTPLAVFDMHRSIFTFEVAGSTVLIAPFNPNTFSKKLIASTHPEYVIYSAAKETKKPEVLAGIMADHRFNIRSQSGSDGGVRITIENKKGPEGPDLRIKRY
ncbi:MAG TPA: hypothetical protein VF438_03365 [Candidatus Paceibacterota bacterium]